MRIPTSPDSCLPREFPTGRLPDFVIRSCGLQLGWSRTQILETAKGIHTYEDDMTHHASHVLSFLFDV